MTPSLPARLTALALLLAMALPAAAAVIPAGVQLHPTQTLVRNNGSEPESLDPAIAESVGANNLARDLFEGLTATDATGKTVPGVAESWKQTDPLTWVFKLRPSAKWSNGEPVTAQDFVFGIRRFVDPKTASTYAATFGVFLANGQSVALGKAPPAEIGDQGPGQAHAGGQDRLPGDFPAQPDVQHPVRPGQPGRAAEIRQGLDQARQPGGQRRLSCSRNGWSTARS